MNPQKKGIDMPTKDGEDVRRSSDTDDIAVRKWILQLKKKRKEKKRKEGRKERSRTHES